MGENTKIEWADSTWNPWVGCTKISAACDHCYAEEWAGRFGQVQWGDNPRKRTSDANWRKPRKWNRDAEKSGKPHFVFCASLADVFDNQVPTEWRNDLWELIASTRNLTWLLLTKRPQNIQRMLPVMDSTKPGYKPWNEKWPWKNVWLGTTVENQQAADRNIPALLAVPAVKRFLSCEPLLGPVDLTDIQVRRSGGVEHWDCLDRVEAREAELEGDVGGVINWVIAGGESGPNARPSHPDWFRSLRDQCAAAGTPFLFKQWGEWKSSSQAEVDSREGSGVITHEFEDRAIVRRVGKKRAGRLLDGVQHDGRPEA